MVYHRVHMLDDMIVRTCTAWVTHNTILYSEQTAHLPGSWPLHFNIRRTIPFNRPDPKLYIRLSYDKTELINTLKNPYSIIFLQANNISVEVRFISTHEFGKKDLKKKWNMWKFAAILGRSCPYWITTKPHQYWEFTQRHVQMNVYIITIGLKDGWTATTTTANIMSLIIKLT